MHSRWLVLIAILANVASADSWWTKREPSEWDAQMSTGFEFLPFEDSWRSRPGTKGMGNDSGEMAAFAFRGGAGWTHPSGLWGLEVDVAGGPRFNMFESDETNGSYLEGAMLLRWDPFVRYQFAPVLGVEITGWHARQEVFDGVASTLLGGREEPRGVVLQERDALSIGTRTGLRLGWFEMYVDFSKPILSSESRSFTVLDSAWKGGFARNSMDVGLSLGYELRVPFHELDGSAWSTRREAALKSEEAKTPLHVWTAGYEWSYLPPVWRWHSALDEAAGGARNGVRIRWEIASSAHPDGGVDLELHEGVLTGGGDDEVGFHSSVTYGADGGVWWQPFPSAAVPLRLRGTLGLWKARSSASAFAQSDSTLMEADWWGARASVGARTEYGFLYGGGCLRVDFVDAGQVEVSDQTPRPERADPVAVGGSLEAGFLYRF